MSADPETILKETMDWFFANDAMASRMEEWAKSHCDVFEFKEDRSEYDSTENKLEYTKLYEEFAGMFESELTAFLQSKGWSLEQFVEACQKEENQEGGGFGTTAGFILAITEFTTFKSMMMDEKRKKVTEAN